MLNEFFYGSTSTGSSPLGRSLRFNAGDSSHLSRTPSSASNRKTWTWSGWVKRSNLSTTQTLFSAAVDASNRLQIYLFSDDTILIYGQNSGSAAIALQTVAVYRDPSSWFHLLVSVDTTQSTAADRCKIHINGGQPLDITGTPLYPAQNTDLRVNDTCGTYIGTKGYTAADYADCYLADVYFIDGQALAPANFGGYDSNGVWQKSAYSGTYGTNGFYLDFSDNSSVSDLGTDTSGNGNDFTVNNLSITAGAGNDSLVDSPTNGTQTDTGLGGEISGNYCVWNPLFNSSGTYSNGNLQLLTTAGNRHYQATIGLTSGKWYWEIEPDSGTTVGMIGIALASKSVSNNLNGDSAMSYYGVTGNKQGGNTSGVDVSYGATFTYGDIIGVALDLDSSTKTLTFYKNGVSQGVAFNPDVSLGGWFPAVSAGSSSNTTTFIANFGQRPFAYPLSGYKCLNTASLPTPTIADGSQYFDTKLYTGTGSNQSLTGLTFQSDFVWIKTRNEDENHFIVDSVRGVTKQLYTNRTDADSTNSNRFISFDSNGFTVGTTDDTNQSNNSFVAYAWDAGTSTVTNNVGTIESQVRANPTAGFSISSYSGNGIDNATVGHGLGSTPGLVIVKRRNAADSWMIYHKFFNATVDTALMFDTSTGTTGDKWSRNLFSSTVFGLASSRQNNNNGSDYIAYCFTPVEGYSAMGSYVGDGSNTSGPFINLTFKPAFLLVKCSTNSGDWVIWDTARSTFNQADDIIRPNDDGAELSNYSTGEVDIVSNGFKLRGNLGAINSSGETYIYYAVSENPFQANGGLAR